MEDAAKQDVDACWKALENTLSPEKYVLLSTKSREND